MAVFGFDDIANHANMLLDHRRVRAFADAITAVVRPGDVVADIGAGTGILAVLAAVRGARRVYAVERGPMASQIEAVARANGVDGVVEVLRADARDVTFAELPNVVISETLGSFGLDEDILGLLQTVRGKVRAECQFVPASLEIEMALAFLPSLERELAAIESGLPIRMPHMRAQLTARVVVAHVPASDLLTQGQGAGTLRVGADSLPPVLTGAPGAVAEGARVANAIVAWFRTQLADGVTLSSGPGPTAPSWAHVVFPLEPALPLTAGAGVTLEVRPRLATDRGTWSWSARCGDEVRHGDAMTSLAGNKASWLEQLGIHPAVSAAERAAEPLARWSVALHGGAASVEEMGRRLRDAFPTRYANDADAVQDALRLVLAAERGA